VETLRNPSGRAAGSALDKDGRLIFTQFDGSLTRLEADGTAKVLADGFEGKKFNMLNDLAVAADGSVYFSDFGAGKDDHIDHAGIYRWTPDGKVACVVKDVTAPNGIALSADGKTLYAALYREAKIMAYTLGEGGGTVAGSKLFAEVKDASLPGRSSPDGLKLDSHGNLWTTGVGGVWVLDPSGKRIGRIVVPMAANLCFGGPDGKTVFVAAGPRVVSVRLKESATRPSAAKPADKPADSKPAR
jgi:gluconolactonase